jgi:ribosome maturation factor RimP
LSVTVEDCERVTRQLQYVLEVEGVDYARLEVGSPGVDRPLKNEAQFVRFSGFEIDLTLKMIFQGRKRYRGVLHAEAGAERFDLVFHDGKEDQVLGFTLAEVREARLVPVLDFKGRQRDQRPAADAAAPKRKRARSNAKAKAVGPESGGHEE